MILTVAIAAINKILTTFAPHNAYTMKKTLLIIAALLLVQVAAAAEYKFPPQLLELIEKYEGTEAANLPNPKKVREEADAFSFPPAKLSLPVNVIIDKRRTTLYVVNVFGDTLDSYRCCASRAPGQKRAEDDCRTPEGKFKIAGIYNSTDWRYKKVGAKCYGPFFVSLITPGFYGIGIHGTNAPGSIPGRSSHGCIRLRNENIVKLRQWLNRNSTVTILPDNPNQANNEEKRIRAEYAKPGQEVKVKVSDEDAAKAREAREAAAPKPKAEEHTTTPATTPEPAAQGV